MKRIKLLLFIFAIINFNCTDGMDDLKKNDFKTKLILYWLLQRNPNAIPLAPSNLAVKAVSSGRIELTWNDNSLNEHGFEIERSEDGSSFSPIGFAGTDVRTYRNSAQIIPSTTYHYRVRAYNNQKSEYSNVVTAKTLTDQIWYLIEGGSDSDDVRSILQTSDGGYIAVGHSKNGTEDYMWIVKLDNQGNISWHKKYGGTLKNARAYTVQQTSDGGYIVGGEYNKDSAWVVKLDKDGNQTWQMNYTGIGNFSQINSIRQITDGYIVAGETSWIEPNLGNVWLLKIDNSGTKIWGNYYGGKNKDNAKSIQLTTDGGYIIVGSTSSNDGDVSSNHGGFDIWILKLDQDGNKVWDRSYGGLNDDFAYAIQRTTDGGYIVAGNTYSNDGDVLSNNGGSDVWVIKLDIDGDIEWSRTYGGLDDDGAYSIHQTTDGGYIVAGKTYSYGAGGSDIWIIKLDSSGNKLGDNTFSGISNECAYSIRQTIDGGYIVAGETSFYGNTDMYILKLNENYNLSDE